MRILIYRLGSLGDTVVALPCFRLIARAFPHSERRVLTNVPINAKAPALSEILNQSGLVNGYFEYPVRVREFRVLFLLAQKIRRWKPDVLVYLAEPRSALSVRRDLLFFRLCGISRIVGAPTSVSLRTNLCSTEGILEYEASRLARCLAPLGDARLDDQESWNLSLSHAEQAKAEDATATMVNHGGFLACSAGTKIDVKDWGEQNWGKAITRIGRSVRGLGLIVVGSNQEAKVASSLIAQWGGPVANLCGKLSPRETAAVLGRARGFVGHDSGPMHLAAAMGTPCVAVFSARNIPKVWYPYGDKHHVIYHRTACAGCGLEKCVRFAKRCIESITVDEVSSAVMNLLDRYPDRPMNHLY